MSEIVFSILLGYGLGSIPFGLVLTRLAGLGDIRNVGSGNIGATNVLRTGRKDVALATLLLDGAKAAIAVLIASALGLRGEIAGAAALIGHCYPVWLRFKGGKGVATFLGALLVLAPLGGVFTCLTWAAGAFIGRISSLSALISAAAAPLILFAMGHGAIAISAAVMAAIIFLRHKDNIARLLKGAEPRIGSSDKGAATPPSSAGENDS